MMKLNKPEDVAAMLAAVNARARSWRPDNRRTRAEVTADCRALARYESTAREVVARRDAEEHALSRKGEAAAITLAADLLLLLARAGANASDIDEWSAKLSARFTAREERRLARESASEARMRELDALEALDTALCAELDKAAP